MMNTIFQLRPLQHQAEQKLIYNDPRVKKITDSTISVVYENLQVTVNSTV